MKTLSSIPIPARSLLLSGLSPDECLRLFAALGVRAVRYSKGEAIIRQGIPLNHFWLLVDGEAHAYVDHCGRRLVASVALPGDTFGLLFAYSGLDHHPTRMVAVKDSLVLEFPVINLPRHNEIVSRAVEKRFVSNMLSVMSHAAFRARFRTFVVSHKSLQSRISAYLCQKSELAGSLEFKIPLDRQELADFLDVDRSALSAALGRMRDAGLISFRKNHFRILRRLCPYK